MSQVQLDVSTSGGLNQVLKTIEELIVGCGDAYFENQEETVLERIEDLEAPSPTSSVVRLYELALAFLGQDTTEITTATTAYIKALLPGLILCAFSLLFIFTLLPIMCCGVGCDACICGKKCTKACCCAQGSKRNTGGRRLWSLLLIAMGTSAAGLVVTLCIQASKIRSGNQKLVCSSAYALKFILLGEQEFPSTYNPDADIKTYGGLTGLISTFQQYEALNDDPYNQTMKNYLTKAKTNIKDFKLSDVGKAIAKVIKLHEKPTSEIFGKPALELTVHEPAVKGDTPTLRTALDTGYSNYADEAVAYVSSEEEATVNGSLKNQDNAVQTMRNVMDQIEGLASSIMSVFTQNKSYLSVISTGSLGSTIGFGIFSMISAISAIAMGILSLLDKTPLVRAWWMPGWCGSILLGIFGLLAGGLLTTGGTVISDFGAIFELSALEGPDTPNIVNIAGELSSFFQDIARCALQGKNFTMDYDYIAKAAKKSNTTPPPGAPPYGILKQDHSVTFTSMSSASVTSNDYQTKSTEIADYSTATAYMLPYSAVARDPTKSNPSDGAIADVFGIGLQPTQDFSNSTYSAKMIETMNDYISPFFMPGTTSTAPGATEELKPYDGNPITISPAQYTAGNRTNAADKDELLANVYAASYKALLVDNSNPLFLCETASGSSNTCSHAQWFTQAEDAGASIKTATDDIQTAVSDNANKVLNGTADVLNDRSKTVNDYFKLDSCDDVRIRIMGIIVVAYSHYAKPMAMMGDLMVALAFLCIFMCFSSYLLFRFAQASRAISGRKSRSFSYRSSSSTSSSSSSSSSRTSRSRSTRSHVAAAA